MKTTIEAQKPQPSTPAEHHLYFADMCHEMCSPLTAILGVSQVLLNAPYSEQRQRQYVEILRDSSTQLKELVEQILDSWRLESGVIRLTSNIFDIEQEAEKVVHIISPLVQKKHLTLYTHIEPISVLFLGDALRLRQIMLNLLSNAVKFTESGHINFDVRAVPNTKGEWLVRIQVSDTGIGIPSQQLEHVFERYCQADKATYSKYGGSGLGLGICRSLAHMMNGEILVSSTLGKGSCFTALLNLPAADSPQLPAMTG